MRNIVLVGLLIAGRAAQDPRPLTVAFGPEPLTLDPAIMSGINESRFAYALYEGLITYKEDGVTPAPGVAESWTVSADGTVYTFKLRKTTWSNGDPVTAHDFEWSWKRLNDPATGADYGVMAWYLKNAQAVHWSKGAAMNLEALRSRKQSAEERRPRFDALKTGARKDLISALESFRGELILDDEVKLVDEAIAAARDRASLTDADIGVKALDDLTLEVTLASPTPWILDVFGFHSLMPVHRKLVERHGKDAFNPDRLVGNGPFAIEEWKPDVSTILRKNLKYHDAANVKSERIVIKMFKDAEEAFAQYEDDKVDFLDRILVPPDRLEAVMKRKDFVMTPSFGVYFMRFNTTRPPFDDPRVRKAFAHAIDREAIVKEVLRGGEKAWDGLIPPFESYEPATKGTPYDPAEARKLMDEVYPDRSKFPHVEFLTRNSKKGLDIYDLCKLKWKDELGVDVDIKTQPWVEYLDSMLKLEYDVSHGGWISDYYDPHTFIDIWVKDGGNNRTGWSDKEYDRWVVEACKEADTKKRFAIYQKCEKRLIEEACVIAPMYLTKERMLMKPRLKGAKPNAMDRFLLKYFEAGR